MNVAPNSPSALAKLRIRPVIIDLDDNGRVTNKNTFISLAPSTLAASSIPLSTDWNPIFTVWYINGKATMVEAITAAKGENIMELANSLLIINPSRLLPPKKKISKKPITVGGKTMGSKRKISMMILPLKLLVDSNLANSIPKTNTKVTEIDATFSDKIMGAQNSPCIRKLNPKL
jgi:hypothetical protein